MNMNNVVSAMRARGNNARYWVREDGVKMLGDYVMVAANLSIRPKGTILPTSLGMGIVVDTGSFALRNPTQLDIATAWQFLESRRKSSWLFLMRILHRTSCFGYKNLE